MQNFTELYEVERRYEELAHKMSTPDAAADAEAYARMMRDYKELTPLIEEYRRYTDLQQQAQDAKEMLAAESDPAFAAMVQQELCEIGRNLAQSEENLRLLLIPKDADDEKSVRRRGGRPVCPQPVAYVHDVRCQARLAVQHHQRQRDRARRHEGDRILSGRPRRIQPPEI